MLFRSSALVAFLVQRAVFAADMILLAPIERFERFRVVPMSTAAAKYWHGRIMRIASIFAAGTVVFNMMTTLGMPEIDWLMFAYVVDFVFLVLLVEATLRRPEPMQPRKRFSRAAVTWFTCGCLVVLYALRIADAMHLFWLVLFIVGLPAAIEIGRAHV